ncbi:LysR substrate-binding domain-containing protein [Pelistega suis]|uniref:LysR substrate-binding domain-containing protein n=1 Tax=Pelistega suis TaxID=1631957 RepID=UPI00211C3028|nr:LysR substrate-binding domain-containing protein [Pelistega suis]MCQ9329488.1 LysR substrate-binding domain-containing protein [Pelistega suis]MDY3331034.1 LysR substrate-binding domain-containing protein [Pelistega sp.]
MAVRFDLNDMQLMVNISQAKSLTKAAERSFLSLPAASNRIKNLEGNLGTSLLYRSSQGVTLTPAGEVFVKHATTVLSQLEHLHSDIGEFAAGIKGKLRVLVNTTAMSEFMPSILSRYLQAYPDISIELRERLSYKIVQAIGEGSADIGVVAGIDLATLDTSVNELEFIPYRKDNLVLITPQSHALAQTQEVAFADTLGFDYVGLSEWSAIHHFLRQAASKLGIPLKFRVEVGGFEGICRMVAANVGIAVIPETVARRQMIYNDIKVIRLKDEWATRQLHICFREFNALPPFAQDLVNLMKEDALSEEV